LAEGGSHAVEEQPQGFDAQTLASVGEGTVIGVVVGGGVQVPPDLGERAVAEQGAGDDEPDDVVSGEVALSFGVSSGALEDVEDEGEGEQLEQG
jgi:hypothetical protein